MQHESNSNKKESPNSAQIPKQNKTGYVKTVKTYAVTWQYKGQPEL